MFRKLGFVNGLLYSAAETKTWYQRFVAVHRTGIGTSFSPLTIKMQILFSYSYSVYCGLYFFILPNLVKADTVSDQNLIVAFALRCCFFFPIIPQKSIQNGQVFLIIYPFVPEWLFIWLLKKAEEVQHSHHHNIIMLVVPLDMKKEKDGTHTCLFWLNDSASDFFVNLARMNW